MSCCEVLPRFAFRAAIKYKDMKGTLSVSRESDREQIKIDAGIGAFPFEFRNPKSC